MKKLVIVGAGGHGKVVADAASRMAKWDVIEFVDVRYPDLIQCACWQVVGKNLQDLDYEKDDVKFVVAVGNNALRLKLFREAISAGFEAATVIHPSACVSEYSEIGKGTVIFANAVVNIHASLGECVIVNTGATVDHDCNVSEGVHLSPGVNLAGEVSIGLESWVGIGASVLQQITIAENVMVGAGAVVIRDIPANMTVVGVPAKPI